jgi:3-oxoacyl-[acyl-carrier protein] reductase
LDLGIANRVALVMGASSGIGRAAAESLAHEGARVAAASRSSDRIEQTAAELSSGTGADVRPFTADTDAPETLPDLVQSVREALGPVEILVVNTGGPAVGDPLSFGREQWEGAYRSLVLAPMALIEAVVPDMRARGWGRIVNVTSTAANEPIPGLMLSNSHRRAAVGAFQTLSRELGKDGILLNSVAPGRIATERIATMTGMPLEQLRSHPQPDIPVGRLGEPREMGDVIAFLCSERASYVTGISLTVDGGLTRGA